MTQSIKELKFMLFQLRRNGKPKGSPKEYYKRSIESLEKRIKELEQNPNEVLERSSGTTKNKFWKVTEENHMRETLGTAWDYGKKMKITDCSKNDDGSWLSRKAIRELNQKKQQDFKNRKK